MRFKSQTHVYAQLEIVGWIKFNFRNFIFSMCGLRVSIINVLFVNVLTTITNFYRFFEWFITLIYLILTVVIFAAERFHHLKFSKIEQLWNNFTGIQIIFNSIYFEDIRIGLGVMWKLKSRKSCTRVSLHEKENLSI